MYVKVMKTNDTWYGMTYHEDVAAVKDTIQEDAGGRRVQSRFICRSVIEEFCLRD